jgi:hypothetical protein
MISAPDPFRKERSMRAVREAFPLVLLALLAAAPGGDRSIVPDDVTKLRLLEGRRRIAFVEADVTALGGILDEELRYVHANGKVATRKELIDSIGSGRLDYVAISGPDPDVRVYGTTGVVTGSAELEVRAGDGPIQKLSNLYMAIYTVRRGELRLVAYQSTPASGR